MTLLFNTATKRMLYKLKMNDMILKAKKTNTCSIAPEVETGGARRVLTPPWQRPYREAACPEQDPFEIPPPTPAPTFLTATHSSDNSLSLSCLLHLPSFHLLLTHTESDYSLSVSITLRSNSTRARIFPRFLSFSAMALGLELCLA